MRTLIGLTISAALLGAIGCTTTDQDKWVADRPPPLAKKNPAPATTVEPVKLSAARAPLTADEIDDTNYGDAAKRLAGELKDDGRASAKAGR
jgi:hypothetical protein